MSWVLASGVVLAGILLAVAGVAVQLTTRARMTDGAQLRRVDGGGVVVLIGLASVLIGLGYLGFVLLAPR